MRKKVLFLVAGKPQVPAIRYAKSRGYYVITCDKNPLNPGHKFADEALNISSYKKEDIYRIVRNKSIDAVVSFLSSHGLESCSFISQKLGLPGISLDSMKFLTNKSLFRDFLGKHSFNVPKYVTSDRYYKEVDKGMKYPLIIKPVDRGANVGISKIGRRELLQDAFDKAQKESISGQVIIEEFISGNYKVNGDFLIVKNKIIYSLIGDYHYDSKRNPILAFATTFPSVTETATLEKELEKILEAVRFGSGIVNLEAIVVDSGIYFIEINPRHSGNLIYRLMSKETGINFAGISVEMALGNTNFQQQLAGNSGQLFAYCILKSNYSGKLDSIEISPLIEKFIIEEIYFKKAGDDIHEFKTLHDRVGLLLMEFENQEQMHFIISNIERFYKIKFVWKKKLRVSSEDKNRL